MYDKCTNRMLDHDLFVKIWTILNRTNLNKHKTQSLKNK